MAELVTVVDSDGTERRFLSTVLAAEGLSVIQLAQPVDGIVAVMDWHPSLVVLAEDPEPLELEEVLSVIRRVTNAPVVIIGSGGAPTEIESLGSGGDVYLRRPVSAAAFLMRVRTLLRPDRGQPDEPGAILDQIRATLNQLGQKGPYPGSLTA